MHDAAVGRNFERVRPIVLVQQKGGEGGMTGECQVSDNVLIDRPKKSTPGIICRVQGEPRPGRKGTGVAAAV
jgi:hypothetical protein